MLERTDHNRVNLVELLDAGRRRARKGALEEAAREEAKAAPHD